MSEEEKGILGNLVPSLSSSRPLTPGTRLGLGYLPFSKKFGNLGVKLNGTVIFRKIRSEIVDYIQR